MSFTSEVSNFFSSAWNTVKHEAIAIEHAVGPKAADAIDHFAQPVSDLVGDAIEKVVKPLEGLAIHAVSVGIIPLCNKAADAIASRLSFPGAASIIKIPLDAIASFVCVHAGRFVSKETNALANFVHTGGLVSLEHRFAGWIRG